MLIISKIRIKLEKNPPQQKSWLLMKQLYGVKCTKSKQIRSLHISCCTIFLPLTLPREDYFLISIGVSSPLLAAEFESKACSWVNTNVFFWIRMIRTKHRLKSIKDLFLILYCLNNLPSTLEGNPRFLNHTPIRVIANSQRNNTSRYIT